MMLLSPSSPYWNVFSIPYDLLRNFVRWVSKLSTEGKNGGIIYLSPSICLWSKVMPLCINYSTLQIAQLWLPSWLPCQRSLEAGSKRRGAVLLHLPKVHQTAQNGLCSCGWNQRLKGFKVVTEVHKRIGVHFSPLLAPLDLVLPSIKSSSSQRPL